MRPEYIPASLYRHPAWRSWKESLGWRELGRLGNCPLYSRPLGGGASMAYAAGVNRYTLKLPLAQDGSIVDYDALGLHLEQLSREALPLVGPDCICLRWDLMTRAWTDDDGRPLDPRLLELRMNASTQDRRLRKSVSEHMSADTMLVDLAGGEEAILRRMDYRTRYSVRLARRRGTRVRRAGSRGLADFCTLYSSTSSRHGLPRPAASTFSTLFESAGRHGLDLTVYEAESAGETLASAIFARHGGEAWYLFAASSERHRAAAGPSAILHQALLDCSQAGDRRMDLVGVAPHRVSAGGPADRHPLDGITLFKKGFGGERRQRMGAWDYVIDEERYAAFARAETLSLR